MFVLVLVGGLVLEVFVFIEVGLAIGWALASGLLIGTSLLGLFLFRFEGRAAVGRVSLAASQRRAPGRAALDAALGLLGCVLLVVPGFITDALGALLLLPATRALVRRGIVRQYARRVVRFAATAARFSERGRRASPADIESTAVEEDQNQLGA